MVSANRSLCVLVVFVVWMALSAFARAGAQSSKRGDQAVVTVVVLDPNTLRPVAGAPWYAMSTPARGVMTRVPWTVYGSTGLDGTGRLALPTPTPKDFELGVRYIGTAGNRRPSCGDLLDHATFTDCTRGQFSTRRVLTAGEVSPNLYCPIRRRAHAIPGAAQAGTVPLAPGVAVIFAVRASPVRPLAIPGPAATRSIRLRVLDAQSLRPVQGAGWAVRCVPPNLAWATWAKGRANGRGEATFEVPQPAPAKFYVFYGLPGEYASCSAGEFDTLTVIRAGQVSPNLCDRSGRIAATREEALRPPVPPKPGEAVVFCVRLSRWRLLNPFAY